MSRELESTQKGLRNNSLETTFTQTYQPKPVIRPSHIEPGGLDAEDWAGAELEYKNWPDEQEKELDRLETEEEALSEKLTGLLGDQAQLGEQNPLVITRLATLEKERIAANARRVKKDLEKKQGVHFNGTEEVVELIGKLKKAEKAGKFNDGESVNGWTHVYTSREGYAFHLNEGNGPLGGFDASIAIGRDPLDDAPNLIHIRFANLLGVKAERLSYGTNVDQNGTWSSFNVKRNLVKSHFANQVKPALQFGGHGPFVLQHTGIEVDFDQTHFDDFRSALKLLVDGAQNENS